MGNTFCGNGSNSAANVASSPPPTKGEKESVLGGRFRVTDKVIGRGSFATVKLGTDTKTKKKIAVRIMPTAGICAVSLEHLRREAAIHPTLEHPGIVKCHWCKEDEQAITMVQEFVPDGSLLDYYAKRRVLLEFEVRALTQQLVAAVAYLHDKGIVHRDIKADNILIFADTQTIKLADFGFADMINPARPHFTNFPGTLAYSPPEVLMGKPHFGPPRDMWSLGVLIYILLTGRYPFGSQATQKTKQRVLNDEPDYVTPKLSAQAKDLLQKLMEKDPTRRMTLQEMQNHPWLTGASIMNNPIIRRASSAISDQLMARKAELAPAQGEDEVRPSPREESPADRSSGSGGNHDDAKKVAEAKESSDSEEMSDHPERHKQHTIGTGSGGTHNDPKKAAEAKESSDSEETGASLRDARKEATDRLEVQVDEEGRPEPTNEPSADSLAMERVRQPRRASLSLVAITLTAGA